MPDFQPPAPLTGVQACALEVTLTLRKHLPSIASEALPIIVALLGADHATPYEVVQKTSWMAMVIERDIRIHSHARGGE